MSIPEGLRDVIGKRLSLLSKECNQLLSVASVIGTEFASGDAEKRSWSSERGHVCQGPQGSRAAVGTGGAFPGGRDPLPLYPCLLPPDAL